MALTDSEYKQKLTDCITSIDCGRTKDNMKLAFELHNLRLRENGWSRENGMHCGGCQTRVINKLRKYLNQLNEQSN